MEQTLLLNASYEPLKIVHWQKAVTLWCQGKVEVISVYDREVRAVSFSFKLPPSFACFGTSKSSAGLTTFLFPEPTSTREMITGVSTAATFSPRASSRSIMLC